MGALWQKRTSLTLFDYLFPLLPRLNAMADADARLSQRVHFDPVAAASLVRPAFAALGVGACIGAALITWFFIFERPLHKSTVSDTSTTALATQSNSIISVQPKTVKSLSFAAEQKPQNNSSVTPSDNPVASRAEAQIQTLGQNPTGQPRCNVSLCESYYQSFRASDCTYQPYSGPRQYCER